jgi:hypothetical protein
MTRINLVPPSELTPKHLVAEYRELPRVFALSKKYYDKKEAKPLPSKYTMGAGHVKFFYDKLSFLQERQRSLVNEMRSRGYNPKYDAEKLPDGCCVESMNGYKPSEIDIKISRSRIKERLEK